MSTKKVIFSEEIDDSQNGQALVLAFLSVGLVLQFLPKYFGLEYVTTIIKLGFIIFGILGMCVELGKKKSTVKGLDNFLLGVLFVGIWWMLVYKVDNYILNIIIVAILFFGLYGFFLGFQQIVYSFIDREKNSNNRSLSKGDYLEIVTKVLGIILLLAQIIKQLIN